MGEDYFGFGVTTKGTIGDLGVKGIKGEKGDPGYDGTFGLKGFTGHVGEKGETGMSGFKGPKSPNGFKGNRGPKGYQGTGGAPGSCLLRFSNMPFVMCHGDGVCNYAQRNDYSYCLTTPETMPMMMTPIPAKDLCRYISRCCVCEAITKTIAILSQSTTILECPAEWSELWIGYSFLMMCCLFTKTKHSSAYSMEETVKRHRTAI